MAAQPQPNRLPFEPSKKRQKPAKNSKTTPETTKKSGKEPQSSTKSKKLQETAKHSGSTVPATTEAAEIPKVVSNRMARRMAIFCGVPTALGMVTFIVSYITVSHGWFKLPNVAVVLVSLGFFGLGVLGLSYGVISASWDEEIVGSKLGWLEFKTNWGRLTSAWRSSRQKNI